MKNANNKVIKNIVKKFSNLQGSTFVGIKGYQSTTSGEVANHVVNAGFSYGNAVKKDLTALQSATDVDIKAIAEKGGFTTELVKLAIENLTQSFVNNQNEDTKSNQSKAQTDTYIDITNGIKLNLTTGKLHIYAMAVSKVVLVEGTFKSVNSRELTLAQNAVKKYFDFSTTKYRNFIIDETMLSGVNMQGEKFELA